MSGADELVVSGTALSPEDFAKNAILELIEGNKIKYHKSKGSLFGLLATAVRHDILDAFKSPEHKRVEIRDTLPPEDDQKDGAGRNTFLDQLPSQDVSIEELLEQSQYVARVRAALADEPELVAVADAVFEGFVKPDEIAEVLGISVEELRNYRRRIERRLISRALATPKVKPGKL